MDLFADYNYSLDLDLPDFSCLSGQDQDIDNHQWITNDKLLEQPFFEQLEADTSINFNSLENCPLNFDEFVNLVTPPTTPNETSIDEVELSFDNLNPNLSPKDYETNLSEIFFQNGSAENQVIDVLFPEQNIFSLCPKDDSSDILIQNNKNTDSDYLVDSSPSYSSDDYSPPPVVKTKTKTGKRGRPKLFTDNKVVRKRVQNKNAAQRYRSKKREEDHVLKGELDELETRNSQLKEKVADITKEINYLKKLFGEIHNRRSFSQNTF